MLLLFWLTICSLVCGNFSDLRFSTFLETHVADQGGKVLSALNDDTHETDQVNELQKKNPHHKKQNHHGGDQLKHRTEETDRDLPSDTRSSQNSTIDLREFHHRLSYNKNEALFLTPLIENGEAKRARQFAKVPTMKGVESFAGYLTINSTTGSNLFFWLFKNQETTLEERPLIVWLHGGYAQMGLFGLFRNVGPFYLGQDRKLKRRKYSWNRKCNLVFVDSPVGAGFSFTKLESGYPSSLKVVAEDLYKFLVQLHKLFPSFRRNELILVGDSSGTKVAQLLSRKIYEDNQISDIKLNLKRLVLVSKLRDVGVLETSSAYLFALKLVDDNQRQELARLEANLRGAELSENGTESLALQILIRERIKEFTGLRDTLDSVHDNIAVYQAKLAVWFLSQSATKRALHVGEYNLTEVSAEAVSHLKQNGGLLIPTKPILEDFLTAESLPILSMNGQFDTAGVISGGLYDSYKWPRADEFFKARRCQLKFKDEVAAYYKSAGTLTEVVMRNAGHFLAAAHPRWTYEILHRFIADDKYFQCT
nr:PREDICTED: venom serine carboxypeptidase-like [Bemisia tabaci]